METLPLTARTKTSSGRGSSTWAKAVTRRLIENNFRVELMYPDVAVDEHGNQGFWTLIYNQGFEVVVGTRKYFAFSNYTKENNTVINHCSSTLPGWSHDLMSRNWACYYGEKASKFSQPAMKRSEVRLDLQRKYIENDERSMPCKTCGRQCTIPGCLV